MVTLHGTTEYSLFFTESKRAMPKSNNNIKKPKTSKKKKKELTQEEKGNSICDSDLISTDRAKELRERAKDHKLTIESALQKNKKNKKRGKVAVNKLPHYRSSKGTSKLWPNKDGYLNVNVCSGAKGIFSQLSPMHCGPISYQDSHTNGVVSVTNVENLWQFSKVWPGELNKKGEPTKEFFDRREQGWKDPKGRRWVKKGNGENPNVPLCSYWKGNKLNYIEARKAIYCPEYAKSVVKTEAFKKLEEMLDEGYNVQILGFDGYDHEAEGKSLKDCVNDKSRPFGHEHVLACLLMKERPWEEEEKEESKEEEDSEKELSSDDE